MSASKSIISCLALGFLFTSCDQVTAATQPKPADTSAVVSTPLSAPARPSPPTCSDFAYTDDSVVISTTTPGAKIHYQYQNIYIVAPELEFPVMDYQGPISAAIGSIRVFVTTPNGDTSEATGCSRAYMRDNTLASPAILSSGAIFDYTTDSLEIVSPMPGSTIHYTLDGTAPSPSSPTYQGKIPMNKRFVIRAIATMPGWHPSEVVSDYFKYPIAPWNGSILYQFEVDTRDGQSYPTVKIGTQTWMAKNLNYQPRVVAADEYITTSIKTGTSYNWVLAVNNKICPEGWTIPSQKDWHQLRAYLLSQPGLSNGNLGNALKAKEAWNDPNAVDLYGFRAVPDAIESVHYNSPYYNGTSADIPGAGFWSTDLDDTRAAQYVKLNQFGSMDFLAIPADIQTANKFVRCLKVD